MYNDDQADLRYLAVDKSTASMLFDRLQGGQTV